MNFRREYFSSFIPAMRAIEPYVRSRPRYEYEIHHINPVEHFPQWEFEEWNKVALLLPYHREAQHFCAEIWGGGQWKAVEWMNRQPRYFFEQGASINIAEWREIARKSSEERMKRSPLYDLSLRASSHLNGKNPRRKGSSGHRTLEVILQNPGIYYQEVQQLGPGDCERKWSPGRDIKWDICFGNIAFDPFNEKIIELSEAWLVDHELKKLTTDTSSKRARNTTPDDVYARAEYRKLMRTTGQMPHPRRNLKQLHA